MWPNSFETALDLFRMLPGRRWRRRALITAFNHGAFCLQNARDPTLEPLCGIGICEWLLPNPRIVLPPTCQALAHFPYAVQGAVNPVGRSSFDRVHNFRQRTDFRYLLVHEWCEDHVHVIRHHDSNVEVYLRSLVVQAAIQHD